MVNKSNIKDYIFTIIKASITFIILAVAIYSIGFNGATGWVNDSHSYEEDTSDIPEVNSSYENFDNEKIENHISKKINKIRDNNGLQPLAYSELVSSIARLHSKDMAERGFFSHKNPDGDWSGDRHSRYDGCEVTDEIIFRGDVWQLNTSEQVAKLVIDSWKDSEPHYMAMMTDWYNVSGVGVYITSDGTLYVSKNFCYKKP